MLWMQRRWTNVRNSISDMALINWTKKTIVAPKLKCIPPTSEAFEENVKRAHLQVCIWKAALHPKPPDLDPAQFGWSKDEINKVPMPVILTKGH